MILIDHDRKELFHQLIVNLQTSLPFPFAINNYPSRVSHVNARWIERQLRREPANKKLRVLSWRRQRILLSSTSVLQFGEVTYDYDRLLPNKLVIKSSLSNIANPLTVLRHYREAYFHSFVMQHQVNLPIAPVFASAISENGKRYFCVQQDFSESHGVTPRPLPPTKQDAHKNMDALARFHAFWWRNPLLNNYCPTYPSPFERIQQPWVIRISEMIDCYQQNFPNSWISALKWAQDNISLVWQRNDLFRVTLIHGDCHTSNFLSPKSPEIPHSILIDWEYAKVDMAAIDCARAIALSLHRYSRRELEDSLLETYYKSLVGAGVKNYSFDAFYLDYRWAIAESLLLPVYLWWRGSSTNNWVRYMENCISSCIDHQVFSLNSTSIITQ